jgi:epoxyqueuosine reductase QueG
MSDLVENLRRLARYVHDDMTIASDAADEIERLRAQNAELLEALSEIVSVSLRYRLQESDSAVEAARAAIAKARGER